MAIKRTSRLYRVLFLVCGLMSIASAIVFTEDRALTVLWCMATITFFYMRVVADQDSEFD